MTREEAVEQILAAGMKCRGPLPDEHRETVKAHLAAGEHAKAREVDEANRPGCGYNFGLIVAAGPFDGVLHEVDCPRCGVHITYRAPWFENLTDE